MDGLVAILGFGFLLGIKHALDADHVVAVSAIVSKNKDIVKSSILGVMWGIGHTITLLLAGILVLAFKLTIPYTAALFMEFTVGVILVLLGISIAREFISKKIILHLHPHRHKGKLHVHRHSHEVEKHNHTHERRSLIVGAVHGLAGSAALMLLVLTTVDTISQGILFLLIFGFGSILGMC